MRLGNGPVPAIATLALLVLSFNFVWLYSSLLKQSRGSSVCDVVVERSGEGSPRGCVSSAAGVTSGQHPVDAGASGEGAVGKQHLIRPKEFSQHQVSHSSHPTSPPDATKLARTKTTPPFTSLRIPIVNRDAALMLGKRNRKRRAFLTIGIASVYRKENYLHKTIASLIDESTPLERENVTVVVFLADTDPVLKKKQLRTLSRAFYPHTESGFLQVIESPPSMYQASLSFVDGQKRRTYNDSAVRTRWRAKQVVDFAYLFTYAQELAEYYLVLEDDVLCAKRYLTAIREFIALHNGPAMSGQWVALQFTGFLGIGQLFRSSDLPKLTQFLLLFYREQPVDFLIQHYIRLMVPDVDLPTRRIPALFQHVGVYSTLINKTQTLRDASFGVVPSRKYLHKITNPPADIVTTVQIYKQFLPQLAYSAAPGIFWGIPKPGDTFDIIFAVPLRVSRVVVLTGIEPKWNWGASGGGSGGGSPSTNPSLQPSTQPSAAPANGAAADRLQSGVLEASNRFVGMASGQRAVCKDFRLLDRFNKGRVDARQLDALFPFGIQCVRIRVDRAQRTWLIITEIAVFTTDDRR